MITEFNIFSKDYSIKASAIIVYRNKKYPVSFEGSFSVTSDYSGYTIDRIWEMRKLTSGDMTPAMESSFRKSILNHVFTSK